MGIYSDSNSESDEDNAPTISAEQSHTPDEESEEELLVRYQVLYSKKCNLLYNCNFFTQSESNI